jgi:ribosomal protein S18 acetylase RimI-like enzyme
VLGIGEADARADAARLSFASTMQPDMHRARYRRFMTSPAYVAQRDVVALLPDASIGSFAIWWPDDRVGLAQFEPVGTRPDQQGRGLASAVMGTCMVAMVERGMRQVRVCTDDDRAPANGLYLAMGFTLVDHLAWWNRPPHR